MPWDRRGGVATGPSGERLVWSLAEGARGTRWRESAERVGSLLRTVLLEVTPDGQVARLEVATPAGLLTLHPEADASAMHGNVVTPSGVRHLAFAWSSSHELLVAGSPATDAVAIRRLNAVVASGETIDAAVLIIDDALEPRAARWRIERPALDRWRFRPDGANDAIREIRVAADGRPVLADADTWALEE
jgi:hypothetical protein